MSLVTLTDPRSPAAEAYQALRTNIEFSGLEQALRCLLITCPGPETDKSQALANLAVVMAQAGDRVIVVDGDLRRPQQHTIFNLANDAGLSNTLRDEAPPRLQETEVPNLRVLTAGPVPTNPVTLLSAGRLRRLLADLREQADYVLVDAPPVLTVTDAALWATAVDGVLLVITAGRTKREYAERAREVLEKVQARIVGAVLLNAERDAALVGRYG